MAGCLSVLQPAGTAKSTFDLRKLVLKAKHKEHGRHSYASVLEFTEYCEVVGLLQLDRRVGCCQRSWSRLPTQQHVQQVPSHCNSSICFNVNTWQYHALENDLLADPLTGTLQLIRFRYPSGWPELTMMLNDTTIFQFAHMHQKVQVAQ